MPFRSEKQRRFMWARHPEIARKWAHEDSIPGGKGDEASPHDFDPREVLMGIDHELEHTGDPRVALEIAMDHLSEDPHYYSNLKATHLESLALAASQGPVQLALAEADARQNSTAMVVVPGSAPGKNVCSFVRSLVQERSKLIVVAQNDGLPAGNFERMMRASMPDVEKKLRIMDASGPSLADAINSAERNRHYRPSQALEIYCDPEVARGFQQEITDGSLKFDPTVIHIVPTKVPLDASDDIEKAMEGGDESAMHRVLDPHVFSSQDAISDYRQALLHTEGLVKEMAAFTAQSVLPDLIDAGLVPPSTQEELGEGHFGMVFPSTDPAKVIKVTAQKDEADNARRLMGRTYPGIARVFDAQQLRTVTTRGGKGVAVWVITLERLKPLDPRQQDALSDAMQDIWDEYVSGGLMSGYDYRAFMQQNIPRLEKAVPGISAIVKSAQAAGFTADINAGNIMLNAANKPVLADVGPMGGLDEAIDRIVEAIVREFLTDIADDKQTAIAIVKDVVRKNRALLKARGVDVAGAQMLGAGANGVAWKLRSNRVLKVTTDDAEAHVAAHIKGKRFKHVFTIYDVWAFPGTFNGHHVYGLVTEEGLEKPDNQEQKEFDWMVETLERFAKIADVNLEDDLKLVLQTMMSSDRLAAENKRVLLEYVKKFDLVGMMADMKRLGVLADLHSGNFMRRPDGTFVIIDIGTGGSQESAKPPFIEGQNIFDIEVPSLDNGQLNEFGTGSPGSGAAGPPRMKGSNSSSWSTGVLALKDPKNHVPEDENEDEADRAMDWGPGRVSGTSF